ncbi:MAG: hypothetical protein ACRDV4_01940, partial [Acidimicrobiales bacterium]
MSPQRPSQLPASLADTRQVLHRISAHVLGRRRFEVSGRFGLRAGAGGITTPAFGDQPEIVRITGGTLVREVASRASYVELTGSTLRELAKFAGTDIEAVFSCGEDAPPPGAVDQPMTVDVEAVRAISNWYELGWSVLDEVVADQRPDAVPETIQLWPEHFDAGTSIGLENGSRVNLGVSPGDGVVHEPYLYIGPQGPERPGDTDFWNAPFGAVLV